MKQPTKTEIQQLLVKEKLCLTAQDIAARFGTRVTTTLRQKLALLEASGSISKYPVLSDNNRIAYGYCARDIQPGMFDR